MRKKKIFFSFLLAFVVFCAGVLNVNALKISNPVDGTIIIRWIDYGDVRNERPDEINLVVADTGVTPIEHLTVNLKAADAEISVNSEDSNITEWKFFKRGYGDYFLSYEAEPSNEFYLEYSSVNDKNDIELTGYNYIDSMSSGYLRPTQLYMDGSVKEEAGTLVVTFVKDTLTTKNLTVTYNDCDGRDSFIRDLDFSIKGENVADPILHNAYYNFKINSNNTINNRVNTYTKSIYISGTDAYQAGNPLIKYIFEEDTNNITGRNVTYKIDGDNILVIVNYQAKTKVVPFSVEWIDNDESLRPNSLLLKAYNQNGELEKEINLSSNNNWTSNEILYENMKYSNGTPINYTFELVSNDDYDYTFIEDNGVYKIVAKLKGFAEDDEEVPEVKDNPKTSDNIGLYIIELFVSSIGLFISLTLKKKYN